MKFINDKERLNFLLSSEFEEYNLSPDEYKGLLLEFRNFYRKAHSRNEMLKKENIELMNENKRLKEQMAVIQDKHERHQYLVRNKKEKGLSLKERLTGKIKI